MTSNYTELIERIKALPYRDIHKGHENYILATQAVDAIIKEAIPMLIIYSHLTSSWVISQGERSFVEIWNDPDYCLQDLLLISAGLWESFDG